MWQAALGKSLAKKKVKEGGETFRTIREFPGSKWKTSKKELEGLHSNKGGVQVVETKKFNTYKYQNLKGGV